MFVLSKISPKLSVSKKLFDETKNNAPFPSHCIYSKCAV